MNDPADLFSVRTVRQAESPSREHRGHSGATWRFLASRLAPALLSACALTLAACGGSGGFSDDGNRAIPARSGDPTITLAASVAPADADGVVTINLSGLAAGSELPGSAFTIVESSAGSSGIGQGVVKPPISVEKIGAGTRAAADVAFVFDTTDSMRGALDSVKESILGFVDHLDGKGLDVRVGAVTFGDAFDTKAAGEATNGVSISTRTPPSFDAIERPSFSLTENFFEFTAFIGQQSPRAGNNDPENALGALEFAYDELAWRGGAQRTLIVITDSCSHNAGTYTKDGITAPWIPKTAAAVLAKLKGQAIVHVIAPKDALARCAAGGDAAAYTDMGDFAGVGGSGGLHADWDGKATFDLTELPITGAVTSGYVIKYVTGVDGTKLIRIVVDDGGEIRGEATVIGK